MSTPLSAIESVIRNAFEALACVTTHYHKIDPDSEDADDYVETMIVVESLLARGGVDHRDLVQRFRHGRSVKIGGTEILQGGNRNPQSQIAKLRRSSDPFYMAQDGITDGAAMRMLGPVLYFTDEEELVFAVNRIASITHASPQARLAAVLVALEMRQGFLSGMRDNSGAPTLDNLMKMFERATKVLDLETAAAPFHSLVESCHSKKGIGIITILEKIGALHAATSTPLAAVLATYAPESHDIVEEFLRGEGPAESHTIYGKKIALSEVAQLHMTYLSKNPPFMMHISDERRAFELRLDADTFHSIVVPSAILGGYSPDEPIVHDVFDRWDDISKKLARRWA